MDHHDLFWISWPWFSWGTIFLDKARNLSSNFMQFLDWTPFWGVHPSIYCHLISFEVAISFACITSAGQIAHLIQLHFLHGGLSLPIKTCDFERMSLASLCQNWGWDSNWENFGCYPKIVMNYYSRLVPPIDKLEGLSIIHHVHLQTPINWPPKIDPDIYCTFMKRETEG